MVQKKSAASQMVLWDHTSMAFSRNDNQPTMAQYEKHTGVWCQKMATSMYTLGRSFLLWCTSRERQQQRRSARSCQPVTRQCDNLVGHDLVKNDGSLSWNGGWNKMVERSGVHIPHGWRIGGHFWGMWDKWLLEGVLFLPKYVEWHLFLPI